MKKLFLLNLLMLTLISNQAISQENPTEIEKSQTIYVITKNDGTEYIGKLLSDDGREVLIETEALGKIYIHKDSIRSIVEVKDSRQIIHGEYRSSSPFTSRYIFTNNALPIKKGENYAMVNLFGPEAHFALTDNFNVGVISTWIASPFILALKYSIKTNDPNVNFSIGTLMGTSGYLNTFRSYGGVHWLSMTLGDRMNNLTFSGGYLYLQPGGRNNPEPGTYYNTYPRAGNSLNPLTKGPVFSVAGIARVGAKASFVFDSMLSSTKGFTTATEYKEITPGSYDYDNGIYTETTYAYIVTRQERNTSVLVLMPGMRFQSNEKRAFQISLAGVTVFDRNGVTSFPMPMASWFFKI
ncbi:MAG: hypothetical protein H0X62_10435 [Bacteroidetes bacterium]|nr:hypothetical protein [Bacteroidota bacterium]